MKWDVITVKDEEILLQISLQLCQIDHSFLKNYNRLISAATKVKVQFKKSFREIEDQSDSKSVQTYLIQMMKLENFKIFW